MHLYILIFFFFLTWKERARTLCCVKSAKSSTLWSVLPAVCVHNWQLAWVGGQRQAICAPAPILTWHLLDTMRVQECGHWADATKEVRMRGCCMKGKTEAEAETEGQTLLSAWALLLGSHDSVCPKSCSETMKFSTDAGFKASSEDSL